MIPDFRPLVLFAGHGLPVADTKRVALALDAAIAFGALCAKRGEGGFGPLSDAEIEKIYEEKLARLRALVGS